MEFLSFRFNIDLDKTFARNRQIDKWQNHLEAHSLRPLLRHTLKSDLFWWHINSQYFSLARWNSNRDSKSLKFIFPIG